MEIVLNRPDKSCFQFTAKEGEAKLGSIIFFPKGKGNAHIGYIGLTSIGRETATGLPIGSQLIESCITHCQNNGFESITGSLIPVPGCEHAVLNLFAEHGFDVDKRGNVTKQLSATLTSHEIDQQK